MTAPRLPIGDDDLTAFVDGRLSPERLPDVELYLADHPEVAGRLAADRALRDGLRERLAAKAAEPVPARLRIANIAAARRARFGARAGAMAAAGVLLVAGGAFGWVLRDLMPVASDPPRVVSAALAGDAAEAYRTFVVEVAHPVEVRASDEGHMITWLSRRLGRPLKVPDLTPFGFRLVGGRVLPAGSGAAAMMMFEDDTGLRLTVYVRADKGAETAFQFLREGEVSTILWLDQGLGFAVSAATDRGRLLPIAEAVYKDLGA